MDTSREYIKMCGKAEEIQRKRPTKKSGYGREAKYGDYFYNYVLKETRITSNPSTVDLWLPRQDQLQDMLTELSPKGRFVFLMKWMDESLWCNKRLNCDTSAEIIWLVCIMDRKFNKEWDGKEWIRKSKKVESGN